MTPEEYRLYYANRRVARQLRDLPPPIFRRLDKAIQTLKSNPRPPGSRKLRYAAIGGYRLRVGDYRVLYDVHDEQREVVILRVMHRREIYRER